MGSILGSPYIGKLPYKLEGLRFRGGSGLSSQGLGLIDGLGFRRLGGLGVWGLGVWGFRGLGFRGSGV